MTGKTIILGAAIGYRQDAMQPFLSSCNQAMPNARIVLFGDSSNQFQGPNLTIVKTSDSPIRRLIRKLPRGGLLACRALNRMGTLLTTAKSHSALLTSSFGISVARFFWYLDWLNKAELTVHDNVLLTDTRDVVFQKNPFEHTGGRRLFCGLEAPLMKDCEINSGWLRTGYRSQDLSTVLNQRVLCAGLIGGPGDQILRYLRALCAELARIGLNILRTSGYDQAVHNYLLRTTELGELFEFDPWDSARLCTMHFVSESQLTRTADGRILNKKGDLICILHQYDRRPELVKWAEARWGGNVAMP
jgi:hypothetical protein